MTTPAHLESDARKVHLMKLEDKGSDNNYHHWASCTKDRLESLNLWKLIEGPESEPPVIPDLVKEHVHEAVSAADGSKVKVKVAGNEAEVEDARKKAEPWRIGDLTARTLLKEAVPAHRASTIDFATTAKQIWIALQEEYAPANETRASTLHQKILCYVCTADLDVHKWLDNIRILYYFLCRQSPGRMTDADFGSTIANLLPTNDEWRPFNTMLARDMTVARNLGKPMTSSEVVQRIKAEDWTHRRDDPEILPQIHSLEAMRKRPHPTAFLSHSPNKRQDLWCSNRHCLKRKGHTIEDCLAFGGGKCGQYPEWWTWRKDIHLPPDQRPNSSHQNSSNSRSPATGANRATGKPRAHVAEVVDDEDNTLSDESADVTAALSQEEGYYAFNVFVQDPSVSVTCNTLALNNATEKSFEVYHDSGANRHIFFDRAYFVNYREISPLTIKGFGSTLSTDALGVGDIHLRATCHGRTSTIKLTDVLHVPSARLNLVSQGCLDRRGMAMRSDGGTMVLSSNGTDLIMGKIQRNNLFRLLVTPVQSRSLLDRISPTASPSLAERLSHRAPAAFKAGARRPALKKGKKVSPGFYTA